MLNRDSRDSEAPLWCLSARRRAQTVRRVCEALEAEYGLPRHGNPHDPLDDLIYIMLSNKTGPATAQRVFDELRSRFACWNDVLKAPRARLERIMRPAGLSRVKSQQIRAALKRIRKDLGRCDLETLASSPIERAETYLTSLPGVSDKVAKCVLLYTCGARVLPVDAHVHRIATRLGWTRRKRADQCHAELEAIVPPHRRFAFHVDCVAHGRLICRPGSPVCERCCIKHRCHYYEQRV